MKTRVRYEAPMLVDMSAESAVGETCFDGSGYIENCRAGSCPSESRCYNGGAAVACYSVGNSACHANNNPACYGCCFTGSSVEGALPCSCEMGISAAWSCQNGTAAGNNCWTVGGNVDACW
jgi:hypothetical protein